MTLLQKLNEEYNELSLKIEKLHRFMYTQKFIGLPEEEIKVMKRQIIAMTEYAEALEIRIEFTKGKL